MIPDFSGAITAPFEQLYDARADDVDEKGMKTNWKIPILA